MKKNITWIQSGVKGPDLALNGYDYLVTNTYLYSCLIFENKLDDQKVKTAIEQALPSFPVLTGRLIKNAEGFTVIAQNDKGFYFEVKQSNEPYQQYSTENNFSKKGKKYSYKKLRVVNQNAPLGAIIITHFKDKGSVLTFSFPHSIIDSTCVYFLMAITLKLHGQPIPKYSFDRSTLNFPKYQPKDNKIYDSFVKMNLFQKIKVIGKIVNGYLFKNKTTHLKIDGSTMNNMKLAGKQMSDSLKISTEDILASILWKTIATIRKGKPLPIMSYTVNLRFKTSLDVLYFGNASTGYLYDAPSDLLSKSIPDIAMVIRKGLNDFNDDYASKEAYYLNEIVKNKATNSVIWKELVESANQRAFMFDPGHKFPFYAMDFGSGSPSWYELPEVPLSGFTYTIINPDMQSVDLKVCLPKKEIPAFLKMYQKEMAVFETA